MKNFKLVIIALILATAFGCGVQNTTKKGSSSQSALIAKSGAQLATGNTPFTGDWFGYVDGHQMRLKITTTGAAYMNADGLSIEEKFVTKNNEYFITNSDNNSLSSVTSSGGGLLLTTSDGEGFYFFPMGKNQQY